MIIPLINGSLAYAYIKDREKWSRIVKRTERKV